MKLIEPGKARYRPERPLRKVTWGDGGFKSPMCNVINALIITEFQGYDTYETILWIFDL